MNEFDKLNLCSAYMLRTYSYPQVHTRPASARTDLAHVIMVEICDRDTNNNILAHVIFSHCNPGTVAIWLVTLTTNQDLWTISSPSVEF